MTKRLGMLGFAIGFGALLCAADNNCDDQGLPTLTCQDFNLVVQPGTCVEFQNPCEDGRWARGPLFDGFRLADAPAGVSLRQTRTNGTIRREICVDINQSSLVNEEIEYVYGYGADYGTALLVLSTAQPLVASANAFPALINAGDSTQLTAVVSGGVPPYRFQWTPAGGAVQAPVVSPATTTTYEVVVQDQTGTTVRARVTVQVNTGLLVTAAADYIDPLATVMLSANVTGGTPPYTFAWTPAASLDDATAQNPEASPANTTEYFVTVEDSAGAVLSGSVVVHVNVQVAVSANPIAVNPGDSSQLEATVVGGTPPYSYNWTPAATLNDPTIANPLATPAQLTEYRVDVSDAEGLTSFGTVTVGVIQSSAPTASFTYRLVCCPTLQLDASLSTGNIATYTWDLSWTGTSPDRITTGPTTSFSITENTHGTVTLIVTAVDGQTAIFQQTF